MVIKAEAEQKAEGGERRGAGAPSRKRPIRNTRAQNQSQRKPRWCGRGIGSAALAAGADGESPPFFSLSSSSSGPKKDPEVQGGVPRAELLLLGETGEVPAGAESLLQRPVSRR